MSKYDPTETPEQRGAVILASCAAIRQNPVYILGVLSQNVEKLLQERDKAIKADTKALDILRQLVAVGALSALPQEGKA